MTERAPLAAAIVERVHASFARQGAMATLGADLADVAAGYVAIAVPVKPRLSQQHGFLHAGVVVAALDSACGYAAMRLMPHDAEVLTVEPAFPRTRSRPCCPAGRAGGSGRRAALCRKGQRAAPEHDPLSGLHA
jgi:acyl-coenzyme A thioesterase PaaI-like protein